MMLIIISRLLSEDHRWSARVSVSYIWTQIFFCYVWGVSRDERAFNLTDISLQESSRRFSTTPVDSDISGFGIRKELNECDSS